MFDYLATRNLQIGFLICPTSGLGKSDEMKNREYHGVKMRIHIRYLNLQRCKNETLLQEFVEQTLHQYTEIAQEFM